MMPAAAGHVPAQPLENRLAYKARDWSASGYTDMPPQDCIHAAAKIKPAVAFGRQYRR